jgi:hypothetical protein
MRLLGQHGLGGNGACGEGIALLERETLAGLLESCVLGLESLGHGTAAAEAGGNSGERRHHEHGC